MIDITPAHVHTPEEAEARARDYFATHPLIGEWVICIVSDGRHVNYAFLAHNNPIAIANVASYADAEGLTIIRTVALP